MPDEQRGQHREGTFDVTMQPGRDELTAGSAASSFPSRSTVTFRAAEATSAHIHIGNDGIHRYELEYDL